MITFLLLLNVIFCQNIQVSVSNMDSAIIDVVWCGADKESNDNVAKTIKLGFGNEFERNNLF